MGTVVTTCGSCPIWIEQALSKLAQFDDNDFDIASPEDLQTLTDDANKAIEKHRIEKKILQEKEKREAEEAARKAARDAEFAGQLIDPSAWGKGGKRPMGLSASVKNKAQKAVHAAAKGWHQHIPLEEVFEAVMSQGLVPIQEDGYKWSGMVMGGKECGSEEARNQQMSLPLVFKNADGQWALTTTYLHMSWCTMASGKFEVVCYLS